MIHFFYFSKKKIITPCIFSRAYHSTKCYDHSAELCNVGKIKMKCILKKRCEDIDWIQLALDRSNCGHVWTRKMKLRVQSVAGNFLTSWTTLSFLRMTLFCVVNQRIFYTRKHVRETWTLLLLPRLKWTYLVLWRELPSHIGLLLRVLSYPHLDSSAARVTCGDLDCFSVSGYSCMLCLCAYLYLNCTKF
jgi:hypothetical protein